jgi:SAM-dependent methyltransferase
MGHVTPFNQADWSDGAMIKQNGLQPDYGNWVSARLVILPGVLALVFGGLAFLVPALAALAGLFFLVFAYFAYARYQFSAMGGAIQSRIQSLVLDCITWDGQGKALDIGCGNAPLAIQIAKRYPRAEVTGIDYWGGAWEYAIGVCAQNAAIEGAAGRMVFQKASAAHLPFADGAFDLAVSNLVFHEVRDVPDKAALIQEALRVVRKGGTFVFQDLFLLKPAYGDINALLATIRSWGIERVEFVDTSRAEFIPGGLKLPFMVGTIGILRGIK